MKTYKNIDEYIKQFPKEIQPILEKVRLTIHNAAPDATEAISYGIPTWKLNGNLVHFGAYPKHVGFYPGAEGIKVFKNELKKFNLSKGTVQFPLDKTIPFAIISKIVKFRAKQSEEFPGISNPAKRALLNAKIKTRKDLSKYKESEILELHGMGPSTLPHLRKALKERKMSFKS